MLGIGKKKKKNDGGKAGEAAEQIGRALGKAAGKVDKLNRKRAAAVAELNDIIARAQNALAELEVSLPRGGLLVSVLVLPLVIPVLIFGVSASYGAVTEPDPFLPPFLLMVALTMFFAVLGPLAAAAALRWSAD